MVSDLILLRLPLPWIEITSHFAAELTDQLDMQGGRVMYYNGILPLKGKLLAKKEASG
jgi:hypothetical protein